MKKTLLILAFALVQLTTFAQQAPALQWQKCLGGTDGDVAYSIQPTSDGGYILAGATSSNNGDVTGNYGNNDAWVLKISSIGSLQWQKILGGTGNDYAQSIQPTPDGGYILAGFTQSINGDVTGNHGYIDAWVVKLSSTGSLEWQKTLGGTGEDRAYSIQSTPDGGYIMAGYTSSTNGDITGNHGYFDTWVVKISSTGSLQWQKTLGGINGDGTYSIQPTPDGGYIVAGYTTSTNGDVTGYHGGYSDAWVVKLSSTGSLQWQKALGGTSFDFAYSIQLTPDGGFIVAGFTQSTDGDVSGNHGGYDAWVVKLSSAGILQWQKALGGSGDDYAYSIQPTPDGGYIVSGYTQSIDGDVTGNHGHEDSWVVKLSSTGSLQWQKALGGTGTDTAFSIQPITDGGFIVAGFTQSIDGDVTGNHGNNDAWVVKLGPDLSTTGFEESAVVVYPNPTSTLLTVQNNNNAVIDCITITDLMGKVVLTQTTNTNQVNVAPLASGTYFLEATSGKDQFTTKFVKE